jgi:hypothetical protein
LTYGGPARRTGKDKKPEKKNSRDGKKEEQEVEQIELELETSQNRTFAMSLIGFSCD